MTLDERFKTAFRGRGIHPIAHDALREAMLRDALGRRDKSGAAELVNSKSWARRKRDQLRPAVWARLVMGESVNRIARDLGRSTSFIDRIKREGPPA